VICQDKLHLIDQDLTRGHLPNFPIDIFFHSLAENLNERAIAVILSGTGTDGTRGVRAVNEAGGIVLAQDPETAQFDGMPRSVIATGLADYVLPTDKLARAVYDYVTNAPGGRIKAVANSDLETTLQEITAIVARDQQIDFSHYKPTTLARRIERRRVIAGCNTLQAYMELLAESDKERAALRNDLLEPRHVNHRVIPRTIFTDPQVAVVGMTEEEAQAAGHKCWCNTVPMSLVPRASAIRDPAGMVKMVADDKTEEVLGVSMVGNSAGEVIHEAAMALRFHAKIHDFIDLLHVYPTMAEALKIIAISRYKDPAKLSCCAE